MRWQLFAISLICVSSTVWGQEWKAQTEEEALFIRRIADFWQEGEYQIVKGQIEEFLNSYPDSSFTSPLHETLGDLYLREKNYKEALLQYAQVNDTAIADRVFPNRMQCLYELQWFATLADECESYLQKDSLDPQAKLHITYLMATALYQQCQNNPDGSEMAIRLAQRAKPYFQQLLASELSEEAAHAFVHLCCILGDLSTASQIYLGMAEQNGENREEMLFQAGLLQAEFDKAAALKTFSDLAALNGRRAGDALYNHLALSFEAGHFDKVLAQKEAILSTVSVNRRPEARLLLGRSYLQMKQYAEALQELSVYVADAVEGDSLRGALIDMLEAAYETDNLPYFETAFARLSGSFPDDPQVPAAMFARILLLKKNDRLSDVKDQIDTLMARYPASTQAQLALLERIHIDCDEKDWDSCLRRCRDFLRQFPSSSFTVSAYRFLVSAGTAIAACDHDDMAHREALVSDFEALIQLDADEAKKIEWKTRLAQVLYELQRYDAAIEILRPIASLACPQKADAALLLAFCFRDGPHDCSLFCQWGEEALAQHSALLDEAALHIALFNGYLSQDAIKLATAHLYRALHLTEIDSGNLRWLADYYYEQSASDPSLIAPALECTKKIIVPFLSTSPDPSIERDMVHLAHLYGRLGRESEQIALLHDLKKEYEAHSEQPWKERSAVNLMLARYYAKSGDALKAIALYDEVIAANPTMRFEAPAAAALESARLKRALFPLSANDPMTEQVLTQLKTLVLQRNLANEPIHIEAALEYVNLQSRPESSHYLEKRLALLSKLKTDFESSSDLLSFDYQNNRKALPEKDRFLQAYLHFVDADILRCQSQLAGNSALASQAKQLLQGIASCPMTDFLGCMAREILEQMESQ
jgi:outer membrane protein assembly factor BamD (BamD/ComL family)